MKLTELGLYNPTAVVVAVLLALVFGYLGYSRLPIQLTPELEKPEISIETRWRAAAPREIEAEILEPQEEVLRSLPGLVEMEGRAQAGQATIDLTFAVGMDLRRIVVEVLSRLNRVERYPEDADEPFIRSTGSDSRAIAWFRLYPLPGNNNPIESYQDFAEETIKTRFERVPGVARSQVLGGRKREVRVSFDPYQVADLGISFPIVSRYAGSGEDVSGGFVDAGRREYTLRFAGRYGLEEIGEMVLEWRDGRPVHLRDVAVVEHRYTDMDSFAITRGQRTLVINASREVGVNVLEVMDGLKATVEDLNRDVLFRAGLELQQVYDETIYIDDSIRLLYGNLGIGILLAMGILWLFLRRLRATLAVLVSIPVCLALTFLALFLGGRTLNVISLAGLAFAVGMVLDASIVVLENIVRMRQQGEGEGNVGARAVSQVWGALLASTATTVAVFLPILFLQSEAGQLFADLALSIAVAICASLLVAIYVVPTAERSWIGKPGAYQQQGGGWDRMTRVIMHLTDKPAARLTWILVLSLLPVAITLWLRPPIDYLPEGSRNLVFAFLQPPAGSSLQQLYEENGPYVVESLGPHLAGTADPAIKHYFFVAFRGGMFMGAIAREREDLPEVLALMRRVLSGLPDTLAFANKASLFGGLDEGRSIDVNLQGRELVPLYQAAQAGFGMIQQVVPGANVRPLPGLELARPELRILPVERRLGEAGWDRSVLAGIVRSLGDGYYAGEYFDGRRNLDIILRAYPWATPDELGDVPIVTPDLGTVPLRELARIVRTADAQEIRRTEQRRTVTLRVTPPPQRSLQETLELLRTEVEPKLRPLLPTGGDITYRGTASKLTQAITDMGGSFALAVLVLYLLMSALFRSFFYSLLVVLTLPLATVGGILSLRVINLVTVQPLDLLTMIGFVILLGLVVNNAILLVYRAREAEREGMARREAVRTAIRMRLRPIFMSTLTSLFGMLPLLLIPGPGAEIYRGLAGVIVGGMTFSVMFTLLLLPSMLRVGEGRHA